HSAFPCSAVSTCCSSVRSSSPPSSSATSIFLSTPPTPTNIYTPSLHDALPICAQHQGPIWHAAAAHRAGGRSSQAAYRARRQDADRKSTRLNSSHSQISYAVFCLKKKKDALGKSLCNPAAMHRITWHYALITSYITPTARVNDSSR